MMTAKPI